GGYPVAYDLPYASPAAHGPPPMYAPPVAQAIPPVPPPPMPEVVEVSTRRYQLRGDGAGTAYSPVWDPHPPPPPPADAQDIPPANPADPPASAPAARRPAVPLDRRSGRRAPDEPLGRSAAAISPAGEATSDVLSSPLGPDSAPPLDVIESVGHARPPAPPSCHCISPAIERSRIGSVARAGDLRH